MRLNKGKCELLLFGNNANVHFKNGDKVRTVDKANYLGCVLNQSNNMGIEVKGRIRYAMGTLKKMHTFWRHSNCSIKFKLNVIQAILVAKVLFGLESAELPDTAMKTLDVFHLKCLRKV